MKNGTLWAIVILIFVTLGGIGYWSLSSAVRKPEGSAGITVSSLPQEKRRLADNRRYKVLFIV